MARTSGGEAFVLAKVADLGEDGYTLVDGTGTILSWTAPNDGNVHYAAVSARLAVSSAETGGGVGIETANDSLGDLTSPTAVIAGGQGVGTNGRAFAPCPIGPGATITVYQSSALTAGAAVLYAAIFSD